MAHQKAQAMGGSKLFSPATAIFAVLALVLGYFAFFSYRKWDERKTKVESLETELATLKAKNAALAGAHEVLQNRKFQVCNRTADEVSIPWFTAIYQSGSAMRVFDSARCEGWQAQAVPGGGSPKSFNFASTQDGCNWDGSVIFYAMHITRTNEDGVSQSFNMAGPWQGFDRDCFTLQ